MVILQYCCMTFVTTISVFVYIINTNYYLRYIKHLISIINSEL